MCYHTANGIEINEKQSPTLCKGPFLSKATWKRSTFFKQVAAFLLIEEKEDTIELIRKKHVFSNQRIYIYIYICIYMLSVLKVTFSNHRSYKVYMHWNRDHVFICDAVCRAKLKLLGWITYIYVLIGHTPNIHEHIQSNLKKS